MQLKLKEHPETATVYQKKQLKPKPLNHIMELTQENQTCRNNKDQITIQKVKLIQKPTENQQIIKKSFFNKYFTCLTSFCKVLTKKKKAGKQMDVNESEFTELVQKIRNKKTICQVILPPQKQSKRVLVLDLDQTLIHTTFNKPDKYDFEFEINFNGRQTKVYTVKRFGLDAFLFQMSQIYQVIVFTASQKQYADKVIGLIDPKKRISHVLYRDHCLIINKIYYLKNLKILGRDLKQIILVDDNKMAGVLQPQNFYKIDQFLGSSKDRKLVQLASFLKYLNDSKYILPIIQSRRKFEDIEIKIKQENSNKSRLLEQSFRKSVNDKKRKYIHKKSNSEVENLVTADTQNSQGDVDKDKYNLDKDSYQTSGSNLVIQKSL